MKKILAILLLLTLAAGCITAHAVSMVNFRGGAENFVFIPGSQYSDTDLFERFKNVMPGDVITQNITLRNSSGTRIRLYLRADPIQEEHRALPLLLFKLGHVEKDPRCIGSTLAITWGTYTTVYGINKLINALCAAFHVLRADGSLVQVNYMYSMGPIDPLSGALWKILPYEYWYMLLAVPIIAIYLVALYGPQLAHRSYGNHRKYSLH